MATITTKKTIDDIDGSADAKTISFALQGASYEIDLSETHAQELRDALATYIEHGTKVTGRSAGGKRAGKSAGGSGYTKDELAAIRAWARKNGWQVSDRGRLPRAVLAAFEAAH